MLQGSLDFQTIFRRVELTPKGKEISLWIRFCIDDIGIYALVYISEIIVVIPGTTSVKRIL